MNLHNREQFLEVYTPMLRASVEANPEKYTYAVDQVPLIASRVVDALAIGHVILSPTMKNTAKQLGIIVPSITAIKAYLNEL